MSLTRASIAHRVLNRLEAWPGIQIAGAACGRGVGVSVHARELLHLHTDHEAELFLGESTIKRMHDTLSGTEQVSVRPGNGWIRLRLRYEGDTDLLLALVSVAIKAHDPGQDRDDDLTGCSASIQDEPPCDEGVPETPARIDLAVRERQALDELIRRLIRRFAGTRDAEAVRTTVTAVHHRFDGSPIRDFVPVFVERIAQAELAGR
jgi:hypothetical protein